jgi:hypothetical protein
MAKGLDRLTTAQKLRMENLTKEHPNVLMGAIQDNLNKPVPFWAGRYATDAKRSQIKADLNKLRSHVRYTEGVYDVAHQPTRQHADEIGEWVKKPFKIEKPHGSALHKLQAAVNRANRTQVGEHVNFLDEAEALFDAELPQDFLVEHDWASAFTNADLDGEVRYPFDFCAFEFQITGKRLIALVENEHPLDLFFGVRMINEEEWTVFSSRSYRTDGTFLDGRMEALHNFMMGQIKAMSIALEAEVAEAEIIRAPAKLNHARVRKGELPLVDYRVVNLAKRHRNSPVPSELQDKGSRRSPRLHFRRGHWKHYANHRTWTKWTLVGNPDLGFIEKNYRL